MASLSYNSLRGIPMKLEEVDAILSGELGLLSDANERGAARTYFLERVFWQPAQNTRIVRVAFDPSGDVASIRLCISSDNNNSVFVRTPVEANALRRAVVDEIEAWRRIRMPTAQADTPFNTSLDACATRRSA
jgi:hypothetical protein